MEAREQARYALRCAHSATDSGTKQWWLRMSAFWLGCLSDLQAVERRLRRKRTFHAARSELSGSIH